ncbi:C-type lectin domain family 12 member B [Biomphalaria glabrata]|nr:C-type lectin domain family 12 member B [Biomphalaria glabrata]
MEVFTILACCLLCIEASNKISQYEKCSHKSLDSLNLTLESESLFQCARQCSSIDLICKTFSYSSATNECSLGTCVTTKPTNDTNDNCVDIYVSSNVPKCDEVDGFTVMSYGLVNACVWFSNYTTNYDNASKACISKGAILYTVKQIEKLYILQRFKEKYWIGLTYRVNEKLYRWSDGALFPNTSYWKDIFSSGEPNYPGYENCVQYYIMGSQTLNDIICNTLLKYVCEIPCFVEK